MLAAQVRKGEGIYCSRRCAAEAHPTPLRERFERHVIRSVSCWTWDRPRSKGYPSIRRGGFGTQKVTTHRLAWELAFGVIPTGILVCHSCDNKNCVRPDHLFLGTSKDNTQDMIQKGRSHQQKKTHCPHGHEYSAENTVYDAGARKCKTCLRKRNKEWQRAHR